MAAPISPVDSRSSTFVSPEPSSIWTKPKTASYTMRGLCALPKRVIRPPPASLPMLATVGSLTLRPAYDVKLEDILDSKYLPPLGLRDFEEWLLFKEHSAENLYFIQWLREYRRRYESGAWNDTQLWFSFVRAKASFFTHDGSLELNLPHGIVRDVLNLVFSGPPNTDVVPPSPLFLTTPPSSASPTTSKFGQYGETSPIRPAPSPAQLAAVEQHVMKMLAVSLAKFASDATSNAGLLRRFYCGSAGIAAIGVGLLPILLSIIYGYSRYIRLFAFPCFWLGAILILCAYAKICLVIYFWGDFRQLRGYELDMPPIVPSIDEKPSVQEHTYPPSPMSPRPPPGYSAQQSEDGDESDDGRTLAFPVPKKDLESAHDAPDSPAIILTLPPRTAKRDNSGTPPTITGPRGAPPVSLNFPRSPASSYGFDWDAPPVSAKSTASTEPTKPSNSRTSFLFAHTSGSTSPTSLAQMGSRVTPIFAPVTRVVNPLVVRGLAEVVRRSSFWGAVFSIILTGVCLGIPFEGRGWNDGW